jgi:hypothetical protein
METPGPAAAEVARQVNAQIREIAESLAIQGEDEHKYTFFCECGCLYPLERTLDQLARDGSALAEGHLPWRGGAGRTDESSQDRVAESREDEPPPPLKPLPSS